MNLTASLIPNSEIKPINVFAIRLARKCLLDKYCPHDHPVLAIERDLVEDARAVMTKRLYLIYPKNMFLVIRDALIKMILNIVKFRVESDIDDKEMRDDVMKNAKFELTVLFSNIN